MSYFLLLSRLFCHPCIRKKEPNFTKHGRKRLSWEMEVLACFSPGFDFGPDRSISLAADTRLQRDTTNYILLDQVETLQAWSGGA